ncbi:MAG: ABC transporter permease [Acidobacteriales bacterium]|nr:ABC transporter permease [Terriglobales bacterium]
MEWIVVVLAVGITKTAIDWVIIGFFIAVGMGLAYIAFLTLLFLLSEEGRGVLLIVAIIVGGIAAWYYWTTDAKKAEFDDLPEGAVVESLSDAEKGKGGRARKADVIAVGDPVTSNIIKTDTTGKRWRLDGKRWIAVEPVRSERRLQGGEELIVQQRAKKVTARKDDVLAVEDPVTGERCIWYDMRWVPENIQSDPKNCGQLNALARTQMP